MEGFNKGVSVSALSRSNLAKYPFTGEAAKYVGALGLNLGDFERSEYKAVLDRAVERVREAILNGVVTYKDISYDVELLSFPVAVALVKALGDAFLKRRYAVSEAKRVDNLLSQENDMGRIAHIALSALDWKVEVLPAASGEFYNFSIFFPEYLKVAPLFHDEKWKLVNRLVRNGNVYLTKDEMARLIAEGVRIKVEKRVEGSLDIEPPQFIKERLVELGRLLDERRPHIHAEELPSIVVTASFPPCVKTLYNALLSGKHVSHIGRFTLTSFLLNVGMKPEDVTKLFKSLADADERMTRYQVEHIAGKRGSGTKYTPPNCETLKTHGLCIEGGALCMRVRHPLTYYRRRVRATSSR